MKRPVVLSLFPGLGLLDKAFQDAGFCVVRGPDILWGGDVKSFHVPAAVFDGVIGGPPCQAHSKASVTMGTDKEDLIPEFLRIVNEAKPQFIVMENVTPTVYEYPHLNVWNPTRLRDWDCGGETNRERMFWTAPFALTQPDKRPGKAALTVMATTWKRGGSDNPYLAEKSYLPGDLSTAEYERLQGVPGISEELLRIQANRRTIIHMLGNGVPYAMGSYVAAQAMEWWKVEGQ